jgi:tetratricopeptide (TPR) repeat protein
MVRRQAAAFAFGLLALLFYAPAARGQDEASAQALRRWAAAVVRHQPGSADASAAFVASLTYGQRLQLNPAMELFLKVLRGENGSRADAAQRAIADLCAAVRKDPGAEAFIRRAAVLHTDAAVFATRLPRPDESAQPPAAARRGRQASTPLMSSRRTVMQIDGRIVGQSHADWNWGFARYLLDLLMPSAVRSIAPDRDFVALWYHAADAYLMASGNLAELRPQLDQAGGVLPDDATILFDRACYAEAFGLPYNQALRDDPTAHDRHVIAVAIPSESRANDEAEGLFRRVLAVDERSTEARVRLARLLARNGRHEEAAAEAARALASPGDRVVGFFAHLVAGRSASALGHDADALEHYTSALTLFPDAQSALVGASRAAVMTGDVGAAVSFAQRLGLRSQILSSDPWWSYRLGAGRDAAALMSAVWAQARQR